MAESIHKFQAKFVGSSLPYKHDVEDKLGRKTQGWVTQLDVKASSLPDVEEFLKEFTGKIFRVGLKDTEGSTSINFDVALKDYESSLRNIDGDEEERVIRFPIMIPRGDVKDDGGIVNLLDLFDAGFVNVILSQTQLTLGLNKKKAESGAAAEDDLIPESMEKPKPAPSRRRPRGFDKSIN